jgi:pilus assembly protein Flp/PilA
MTDGEHIQPAPAVGVTREAPTMLEYIRTLANRRQDETGASAVEYGLLVALIAAVIVVAVFALGGLVKSTFNETCKSITSANTKISSTCAS